MSTFRSQVWGRLQVAHRAYKTDAKMLGWKMKDIIAVIKSIFVGAGQQVPTLTKQYAGKVNVKPGDGLIIEGAAGDVSWRLQAERLA
jgi:hypothetical protein